MSIDNRDDVIDSREVNDRVAELEGEQEDAGENFAEDSAAELKMLRKLASDGSDYTSEWDDGATLIRDSHFVTYAQELADDIGALHSNLQWPFTCIDWDQAARELQMDYTSVDFDGVTYWVRS